MLMKPSRRSGAELATQPHQRRCFRDTSGCSALRILKCLESLRGNQNSPWSPRWFAILLWRLDRFLVLVLNNPEKALDGVCASGSWRGLLQSGTLDGVAYQLSRGARRLSAARGWPQKGGVA